MFERLEARRLLASVISGVLTIDGTGGDDVISLTFDSGPNELVVQVNADPEERFANVGITGGLINGAAGNDSITLGAGIANTIVNGDDGNDTLIGAAASDTLNGGDGDDCIDGNAGDDSLTGGAGNDTLQGDDGNDRLEGGDGDDSMSGDDGHDQLDSGVGSNTISGGLGRDRVEALGDTRNLFWSADNIANDGASGETGNIMSDVENMYGGEGDDF
jgi:Ca2+-binding RTX toxin-like protein